MFEVCCFKFLLVQIMAFNSKLRYLWLKNKQEIISSFQTLCSFKVVEDLISGLDFFARQFVPLFCSLCIDNVFLSLWVLTA
jgi:hypothetical protein